MKRNWLHIYLLLILSLIFAGCHIYSFTGASYGEAKTVTINYFPNKAPLVQPTLSQTFTEKLKDRFVSTTPLDLIKENGDLLFEGEIVDYNTAPMAIVAGEVASKNRLTIVVHVKFTNSKAPKQNFDSNFQRYAEYDGTKTLNEVESQLIEEIVEQLVDDIFNKSVVNW